LQARQDEAFQKISAAVPGTDHPKPGFFFRPGILFDFIPGLGQYALKLIVAHQSFPTTWSSRRKRRPRLNTGLTLAHKE
jgi:hypothetical protein